MARSSNKLIALSSFMLVLCAGCQQSTDGPASTADPQPPGTLAGAADSTALAGGPSGVDPSANAAGPSQPGPSAMAAANDPLIPGAQGASSAQAPTAAMQPPPPYPGLRTGPGLALDPANELERLVPTDSRAAQAALQATPISGGTLLITSDGKLALAADPERDRVSIVDLTAGSLSASVALQAGDEPGRLVQDDTGTVHVALRRAGAVASIDLSTKAVVARRAVCASPRGIAFDASTKMLKVACVGGELVDLPAATGEVVARVQVASDLRDVVQTKNGSFVTRLKRAELVQLDSSGALMASARPATPTFFFPETDGSEVVDSLEPVGARRTIVSQDGGFIMLHQGARNGDIEVRSADDSNAGLGSSPYGGAGSCTGVVTTSITKFDSAGHPTATALVSGVLAVDVAASTQASEIAVAFAGSADPLQPQAQIVVKGQMLTDTTPPSPAGQPPAPTDVSSEINSVMEFDTSALNQPSTSDTPPCVSPIGAVFLPSPATAVAYAGDRLVVQTREPAALFIVDTALNNQNRARVQVDLGGPSMLDTGHEIFHRDAGGGVACASCHIEGGDDGHVWHFVDQGARRTQSMLVGLEGTAPFHWVGDMNDLGTLMEAVFVGRMGGVHQNAGRMSGLQNWLFSIKAPPPLRSASDPAAVRGHDLFEGEAECNTCHTGVKLTNNLTVDVGTGLPLQVPSLIGVAYRGPWIHTGCATTLRDRFNPECGGTQHGRTSQLSAAQIDDLVAYLETL